MFIDPQERFTNTKKGSSTPSISTPGLYLGKVVRTTGGIFLKVPKLSATKIFGPCQVFSTNVPVKDATVLVGFLNNRFDDAVVIGIKHA